MNARYLGLGLSCDTSTTQGQVVFDDCTSPLGLQWLQQSVNYNGGGLRCYRNAFLYAEREKCAQFVAAANIAIATASSAFRGKHFHCNFNQRWGANVGIFSTTCAQKTSSWRTVPTTLLANGGPFTCSPTQQLQVGPVSRTATSCASHVRALAVNIGFNQDLLTCGVNETTVSVTGNGCQRFTRSLNAHVGLPGQFYCSRRIDDPPGTGRVQSRQCLTSTALLNAAAAQVATFGCQNLGAPQSRVSLYSCSRTKSVVEAAAGPASSGRLSCYNGTLLAANSTCDTLASMLNEAAALTRE